MSQVSGLMAGKDYEFFDHTADIGLHLSGNSLEALFANAAKGLAELLVEDSPIQATETRPIALKAPAVEDLLLGWLKELLFWFNTDRFLASACRFDILTTTTLQGTVLGERFHPKRHTQGVEVKGVTYHQLTVEPTQTGWEARVIFDI